MSFCPLEKVFILLLMRDRISFDMKSPSCSASVRHRQPSLAR